MIEYIRKNCIFTSKTAVARKFLRPFCIKCERRGIGAARANGACALKKKGGFLLIIFSPPVRSLVH